MEASVRNCIAFTSDLLACFTVATGCQPGSTTGCASTSGMSSTLIVESAVIWDRYFMRPWILSISPRVFVSSLKTSRISDAFCVR